MSYVYIRSEPLLWTVGFYRPDGKFEPESDHGTSEGAARRVAWLNGGAHVDRLESRISELEQDTPQARRLQAELDATLADNAAAGYGYDYEGPRS
jgi:hypothetical protein